MTLQERQQALAEILRNAEKELGVKVIAVLQPEQLGVVWQVRPQLAIAPVEGWQEPEKHTPQLTSKKK